MSNNDLTHDAFLGGRVHAWQPAKGYRAGTDPVLLAAACSAKAGEQVLELGCGVGVASLCLAARVAGLTLVGVERQQVYAELAARNAREADVALEVVVADLADLPTDLRQQSFDHVLANPPYFPPGSGTVAEDVGREAALREVTPLKAWIATALARLKPKGWLTLIQRMDRLPDVLAALDGFGSVSVLPLQSRLGRGPGRFLLRARKGGLAPFALLSPLVVHEGEAHLSDGESYSDEVSRILRDGAPVTWSLTK